MYDTQAFPAMTDEELPKRRAELAAARDELRKEDAKLWEAEQILMAAQQSRELARERYSILHARWVNEA